MAMASLARCSYESSEASSEVLKLPSRIAVLQELEDRKPEEVILGWMMGWVGLSRKGVEKEKGARGKGMTKPKEKEGMLGANREKEEEKKGRRTREATEARLPLIHRDLIRATNFQAN